MSKNIRRANKVAGLVIVVSMLVGLTGCNKDNKETIDKSALIDTSHVDEAVEALYSNGASVPVQYSEDGYVLFMLNSNHEAQAESAKVTTDESGKSQLTYGDDYFSKVYLSTQEVIYFSGNGGMSYGPEISPVDFLTAMTRYYQAGNTGIKATSEYVADYDIWYYRFDIDNINTYEAIYAQRDEEMAASMVEELRKVEADAKAAQEAGAVGTTSVETPVPTATDGAEATGNEESDESKSDVTFTVIIYAATNVKDFEATMAYSIGSEQYLGWSIGGCYAVGDWRLDARWYDEIESRTVDEWIDLYNELIDTINDLTTDMTGHMNFNLGVSLEKYFEYDDIERNNTINTCEQLLLANGYEYCEGKDKWALRSALENIFSGYSNLSGTDVLQAVRVSGVAAGVIQDAQVSLGVAEDGDVINGEDGAEADSIPGAKYIYYGFEAYTRADETQRKEILAGLMEYWQYEGYTVNCSTDDLFKMLRDKAKDINAGALLEPEALELAIEMGYVAESSGN